MTSQPSEDRPSAGTPAGGEAPARALDPAELEALRSRIDDVDRRLIEVLCERARIVVEVGRHKRATGTPIYAPHREREVLRRAVDANPGPLSARTIEAIYRELMSGSFSLELPLRVGFLGPPGSFSHVAATRHFGSSVDLADMAEIDQVFEAVAAGHCHYGVVPYENSVAGGITDTLDAFQRTEVVVYAEALILVRHDFLSNCPIEDVEVVFSKPQVFGQCRRWIAANLAHAELVPTASSSDGVRRAAGTPNAGAIGSDLAGRLYGVNEVQPAIQDAAENVTRFLVIAREHARPSGDDTTTLMFKTAHTPGALVDVLAVFRDAGINLSHIEKRPSGLSNWQYTFFVDCDGHREDAAMAAAIESARAHCVELTVLGSYPKAERSL